MVERRKQTESVLSIQNNALQKLAQGCSLTEYMDILTSGFEKIFKGAKCSVLLLNEEKKRLHSCSSSSLSKDYIDFIDGTRIGPSAGSCGTAVYRGEVVIVENIATDPLWVNAKDIALSHGLSSCWSCPIWGSNNEVLGTYAVYYSSPKKPVQEELDIIKSMAYLAGLAIDNKDNEEKLRKYQSGLESRVEKRTEELRHAKEIAEKANHAKSDFLSRMSHELRTPLNSILGFTQLLQMDIDNPLIDKHRQNIDRVSSAGHHLLELINEVLDLSKIESGKLDMKIETFDIIPALNDVISISRASENQLQVSIKYQENQGPSIYVQADKLRLKQVLLNLTSNAIKYNKAKGSVVISYEKQKHDTIRIGIKDTGYGIPEGQKDKLFKPFERFDVAAEQIEGTGIGLTISKYLIEMMGGTIGFESVEGEGSCFYIDVPVSEETSMPQENEVPKNLLSTSLNSSNEKKILYIEDIPINVELIKQILSPRKDIQFFSSSNAMDGIETAKNEIPDLILMDIHMMDMDGLTAFKKLQTIKETKDIPVIALTADAMDVDVKIALDMGFASYITKPVDVSNFFKTIEKLLPS